MVIVFFICLITAVTLEYRILKINIIFFFLLLIFCRVNQLFKGCVRGFATGLRGISKNCPGREARKTAAVTVKNNRKRNILFNRDLLIIFGVTLVSAMGVTSIAPAFPRISSSLGLSEEEVVMLITVFTFPGIVLSPVMGILADRFGRKRVIVPSIFLFGIAGAACAFTDNYRLLLIFRLLSGVGGAALGGLSQAIIGDMFDGEQRSSALGYNASVLGVGTMVYPAIGGALALLGWNYPFLLSLLALPAGLMVWFGLGNPEPSGSAPMRAYAAAALRFIRTRGVLPAFAATLSTFILLYGGLLAYFPFLMHGRFAAQPSTIGLMLAATSLTTIIGSFHLGGALRRFRPRTIVTVSFFLYAVSFWLMVHAGSLLFMLLPMLIYGLANGINIPCVQNLLSGSVPMEYRGAFMSFNSTVLRLGQTVGPVCAGAAFMSRGMNGILYASIVFSLVSMAALVIFIKD
jgi:MFS transporter, ACDE family, multidrug resistance protein